jgi:small subunit ribosomal protein S2
MSVTINMRELLEAGVHYGHQCRRWNPKMKRYIFGARNGIHIIDLQKTVSHFKTACDFVEKVTENGGHVLFVGTKRQAKDIVRDEAIAAGMFFINSRWLGGTLTNYPTLKQSVNRLKKLETMSQDGTYEKITKKEALNLERFRIKLDRNLGGIKDMPRLPSAIFIVDAHKERIAIKEARKLGIPIVAITDTNADPTGIDYPIPGNDDSLKALELFIKTIGKACEIGKSKRGRRNEEDVKPRSTTEEGTIYDKEGHSVKVVKKREPNA